MKEGFSQTMTVKDVLNLFFLHPVKGLPVTDDKDERILGLISKERIVELGASRSDLDLDISGESARLLQTLDLRNIETFFRDIDGQYAIPVINRKGEIRKAVTKTDLEIRWRTEQEASRIRDLPPVPVVPTVQPGSAPGPRGDADRYTALNSVPAAILVLNPRQVILFANDFFLRSFDMEKELVLRQKITTFFTNFRFSGAPQGIFSYHHKKWNYRFQPGLDESVLVFQEVTIRNAPPEADAAAEKVLEGKSALKPLTELFESRIVKKVYQRTKGSTRRAAELLGLSEENLKYRLQKNK